MEFGSSQVRVRKRARQRPAGRRNRIRRQTGFEAETKGDETMPEAISGRVDSMPGRMDSVPVHPLAELLECPPMIGGLLNSSTLSINLDAGAAVFRQNEVCKGLYVVVAGQFLRKTERLEARLTLGPARPGDLVELAAALGDGHHTYTLAAQTAGSVLLLPMEALSQAFQSYPRLRMQLLEELAREVSRAYSSCWLNHNLKARRRVAGSETV